MNKPKNNKKLVEDFCDAVFVRHDLRTLDRYMRDDYIQHNPDVPQGKSGFRQFFEKTFKAMPDFRYTLKKIVADGNLVFIHCTTTATHTGGEWLGVHHRVINLTLMLSICSVSRTGLSPSTGT